MPLPPHRAPPPSPRPILPHRAGQRFFLHLLAEYDPPGGAADLLRVVDECGGVRHVVYRFFRHYDVSGWGGCV